MSGASLAGKRILVTGASAGIGRATAHALSRAGAQLVLVARDEARLKAVHAELDGSGHTWISLDLAQRHAELPQVLKQLAESGAFYGFVHAAGVNLSAPIKMQQWARAEAMMALNWGAGLMLAKAFRQQGVCCKTGGRAIFISSSASLVGDKALAAYAASKGAVNAMARALAVEWAPERITVNVVAPGFIQTELNQQLLTRLTEEQVRALEQRHPLGLGTPEDVASVILFLMGAEARWITGAVIPVDGGLTAF